MTGTWMMTGVFEFNLAKEVLTIGLLFWLATGSSTARWIVGVLTAVAVLIAGIGSLLLLLRGFDAPRLPSRQQISLVVVGVAVVLYGFVAWRLLLWSGREKSGS